MLQAGFWRLMIRRSSSRSLLRNFSSNIAAESPPTAPPPWLMLPSGVVDDDLDKQDSFHLFSIAEKKIVKIKKDFGIIPWRRHHFYPEGNILFSGSSSYGWLSLVNKRNCDLFLFNPFGNPLEFSQTYITLPPLESIRGFISSFHRQNVISTTATTKLTDIDRQYHLVANKSPCTPEDMCKDVIVKLVMSLPPLSNSLTCNEDCLVMARIQFGSDCREFVCCRPGDTAWTSLNFGGEYGRMYDPDDFTYFSKDKLFYSFGYMGTLLSWDLPSHDPSLVYNCFPPVIQPTMNEHQADLRYKTESRRYYLVDSSGDLLLVVRCIQPQWKRKVRKESTIAFDVYKFDFVNKKWVYVPDLGDDRALFLGLNSFSISLSDNPGLKESISGNSIYFSFGQVDSHGSMMNMGLKNHNPSYHDSGVYNLNDGSITTFLTECFSFEENDVQSSPFIWIHPQH